MKMGIKGDTEIQHAVLEEMSADPLVEEQYLGVSVNGGVVTLTGSVSHYAKRRTAEDAARRVKGVVVVINDIEVRSSGD